MIKNILFQITSTLIAIIVLVYLVLHTLSGFENKIEIKNVYYTTMDLSFDSTAYVFRDEEVLSSKKAGSPIYLAENGEKIGINKNVVSVFADSDAYESNIKIGQLEEKIDYLNSVINKAKYSKPSIPSLDNNIYEQIENISVFSSNGKLKGAINAAEESIFDLEVKHCILNGTEQYETLISEYEREINSLKNASTPSETVSSSCSGYFYQETDGFENFFTSKAIESLSAVSFDELKNVQAEPTSNIGKIAKNAKWYIAFELKTSDAITLSANNKYSVYFPLSEKKLNLKVEKRIDSTDENKKIVVMSSTDIYDGFNFSRKQSISVTAATYSGLAFPASAVTTDFDSTGAKKAGVYILDETVVKFKTFDHLVEKNGYILCAFPDSTNISYISSDEVSLFDAVIVKGTNLYHNKVIKNVLTAK